MTILIIEDEIKAAKELAAILMQIDNTIKIVDNVVSIEQAIHWFETNPKPDLILSDIQLADGLCFDIFNQIQIKSPIIFCTAFDEFMLEAFETNAISYLLKPITKEKVEKALEKFTDLKSTFQNELAQANIVNLYQQISNSFKSTLLLNQKERIVPVQISDIAFFYLDKTMLNITTVDNKRYFHNSSLDEMEKTIDPKLFYRANRQFLINKKCILNIERYFARKLVAKLNVNTPEAIMISKAKATDFLKWVEIN